MPNNQKGFSNLFLILVLLLAIVAVVVVTKISGIIPISLPPQIVVEDKSTRILKTLSGSDEIEVIEKDLEKTDLDSLDGELENVQSEMTGL